MAGRQLWCPRRMEPGMFRGSSGSFAPEICSVTCSAALAKITEKLLTPRTPAGARGRFAVTNGFGVHAGSLEIYFEKRSCCRCFAAAGQTIRRSRRYAGCVCASQTRYSGLPKTGSAQRGSERSPHRKRRALSGFRWSPLPLKQGIHGEMESCPIIDRFNRS
jgi:hypothetical protein